MTTSSEVVRTERGLTISGTRITLYDILGYLHAGWSEERTRDILRLTDEQMRVALAYIATNRDAVEQEYQQVLRDAAETRSFWEERNRDRFAQIAVLPPKPGTEALREKLAGHRARRAEDKTQSITTWRDRRLCWLSPCVRSVGRNSSTFTSFASLRLASQ